MANLSASS